MAKTIMIVDDEADILDLRVLKEKSEKKVESVKVDAKKELKNIALVVTGGTIASKLDPKTGAVKWLTDVDELLRFYPGLTEIANIKKIEVPFMKASENMDVGDWKKICDVVGKLVNDSDIDGVIVTHGTDFLHYTATALSFALRDLNKPVVLTYSQRSIDRASSDANLNLICATRVAVSDIAEVMLVGHATNEDSYCYALPGTKVRKMHTSRRDTFRPINDSPIAKIWPDKIEVLREFNARDNKRKVKIESKFSDKVALVKFYPGQDVEILEHYLKKGYKGVIVEMSGLGHVISDGKKAWINKLKKLIKKGLVVCAVPQTIYGELQPFVYSAGREIEKTAVIYLKDILSETAFVKLAWVLGNSRLKKNVKESMLENFAGEFSECLGEGEFLN